MESKVYTRSLEYAEKHGEEEIWRDSHSENIRCARAITASIDDNYHDNTLDDCADEVIAIYGYDRVNWVLAETIQSCVFDGRYSKENKQWANKFKIPVEDTNYRFRVTAHPGLTNLFTDMARKAWNSLGLYGKEMCTKDRNYEDKVLVLKPTELKDKCKKPEFQLVYAVEGSGLNPSGMGSVIGGIFLKDDAYGLFSRSDFYGTADEEKLPDWAKEKLAENRRLFNGESQDIRIKIYQIDTDKDENRRAFMNMPEEGIDSSIYKTVYYGDVDAESLEDVFEKFNTDRPMTFQGRSLSVSDVVEVLDGKGKIENSCYFCDTIGFQKAEFDPSQCAYMDGIRVVYVTPGNTPLDIRIGKGLKDMQNAVGGLIEPIYCEREGIVLVGNEESKLMGMKGNRRIGNTIIAGPFFVCGDDGENFVSLTDEETAEYMDKFAQPQNISDEEVQADMGCSLLFF